MPDVIPLLVVTGVSALVAALVFLLLRLPWKASRPRRAAGAWTVAVAVSFFLNAPWLAHWDAPWLSHLPHWPPLEGSDRLLVILLPAVVLVELLAVMPFSRWWLAWPLRLLVAAAATPVLLHKSVYFTDPASEGWTSEGVAAVLFVLPALLVLLWVGISVLERNAPGRSVTSALGLTCVVAGVMIALSSSATGGQLGIVLAAALAGALAASLVFPFPPGHSPPAGIAVVGLFGILVNGRFFGELTHLHALILFLVPLLAWLPELPYARKLKPWLRGIIRVALVAVPLVFVLAQARHKFLEDSATHSGGGGPSEKDYEDYGK